MVKQDKIVCDRRRTKRLGKGTLTFRYLLAVGMIAFAVITGYAYVNYYLIINKDHDLIVNVSGKQRMLSQRIALFSHKIINDDNDLDNILQAKQELEKTIATMALDSELLIDYVKRNHQNDVSVVFGFNQHENNLHKTYFEAPHNLANRVKNYLEYARIIASSVDNDSLQEESAINAYRNIMAQHDDLLNSLDYAVTENQRRAEYILNQFGFIQKILLAVILILLISEIFIIFKPLVNQIDAQVKALNKARQKAEELNRIKSEFLANMSHEIRTPMNGILGMAELILTSNPTPQQEGYTRAILNSGETLLNIINDILDFSKIEAGKMKLDIMPLNMLELIDRIAHLYAVQARDKAVELVVHYVPSTEQFVLADPIRIRQIIANLVNNALKFTEKGHIVITVEESKEAELDDNIVMLKFSVSDTGIGMAPEVCESIFEKFTQADNSTTRNYGGTGLGLSICKSLVEMMNGKISVTSELGVGSTFSFIVPLERNLQHIKTSPKPPILRDVRVLVVDDLPIVRTVMHEQLTYASMRCDTAESSLQALEMMRQAHDDKDPYDIAIIDYLMPNMNGEMLASSINDYPELRKTCLIMFTSAGNPLANEDFVRKGFSAYIPKPVDSQSLLRSLAIIWERYNTGETKSLIQVDTRMQDILQDASDLMLPNVKVLVAEDNLINQVFVKDILEEMKIECTVVSNGKEAIDAVSRSHFDIILMDCLMPIMDGFEATQHICRMKAEGLLPKRLPIIALTANAMKEDREKCLQAGMDEYITKPVRRMLLKETIYKWVHVKELEKDEIKLSLKVEYYADKTLNADTTVIEGATNIEAEISENKLQLVSLLSDEILDREAIAQAKSILKDKYDNMVDIFLSSTKEYLDNITNALQTGNIEEIIRPAHTMKSTSRQMGAFQLSNVAKELELMAKSTNPDIAAMESLTKQLTELLSQTKLAFERIAA
jgi:signal transduction histidine kinase/DNA-binding response OmpR family regulator